jgi:hypothetical protein
VSDPVDGITVERTPMRDLARRLLELLEAASIHASIATRDGVEIVPDGACVTATAWDVRVVPREADRARRVIANARRCRRMIVR